MKHFFMKASLCVCLCTTGLLLGRLHAQSIGTPGASTTFINTTSNGGLLAHIQAGMLGSFTPSDRWVGIGQPAVSGNSLPLYGIRIQDAGQAATFSINQNTSPDLEIQWGPDAASKFRLNFITDPLNNGFLNVLTANAEGRVGINEENPSNIRLKVVSPINPNDEDRFAIEAENNNVDGTGIYSEGTLGGVLGVASSTGRRGQAGVVGAAGNPPPSRSFGAAGVAGFANSFGGTNIGVAGFSEGTAGSSLLDYGVYGESLTGVSGQGFAGFFQGDVTVTGNLSQASDERLKRDIAPHGNVMDQIMALRPTTYEFRQEGDFGKLHLSEGFQHGFIAQELEMVFPELVGRSTALLRSDGEARPFTFRSVNYTAMIPILTKGLQEQQLQIEVRDSRIDELEQALAAQNARIARLEAVLGQSPAGKAGANQEGMSNELGANVPNPFGTATRIEVEVVSGAQAASLLVLDLNGQQIRSYDLQPGSQTVTVEARELKAGIYLYSLVVDGQEVATRRMVLLD